MSPQQDTRTRKMKIVAVAIPTALINTKQENNFNQYKFTNLMLFWKLSFKDIQNLTYSCASLLVLILIILWIMAWLVPITLRVMKHPPIIWDQNVWRSVGSRLKLKFNAVILSCIMMFYYIPTVIYILLSHWDLLNNSPDIGLVTVLR